MNPAPLGWVGGRSVGRFGRWCRVDSPMQKRSSKFGPESLESLGSLRGQRPKGGGRGAATEEKRPDEGRAAVGSLLDSWVEGQVRGLLAAGQRLKRLKFRVYGDIRVCARMRVRARVGVIWRELESLQSLIGG